MIRKILFLFLFFPLLHGSAFSKDHDFAVWTSLTLKHKFTTRTSIEATIQERQNRNLLTTDSWLAEIGLEYKFTRDFSASVNYRYIAKNELDYFSNRHRGYIDLKYKIKSGKVTFNIRERIQSQVKEIYSSELGKFPEYVSRTKVSAKLDIGERYTPYAAIEMYLPLKVPNEELNGVHRFRYETGIDYEFNLLHSLNIFCLYQQNLQETINDLVCGVGYTYTF